MSMKSRILFRTLQLPVHAFIFPGLAASTLRERVISKDNHRGQLHNLSIPSVSVKEGYTVCNREYDVKSVEVGNDLNFVSKTAFV